MAAITKSKVLQRCVLVVTTCSLLCGAALCQDAAPQRVVAAGESVRLVPFAQGFRVEQEFVTTVFTQRVGPTDLTPIPSSPNDGRSGDMVVTTYGGLAYRLGAAGAWDASRPFLDLTTPTSPSYSSSFEVGWAQGLVSVAFHPGFADSNHAGAGKFYTIEMETVGSGSPDFVQSAVSGDHHDDVLYEYTLQNTSAETCDTLCVQSKREVLRVKQPAWHHNLGDLLFTDEGLLYVTSADAGVATFEGRLGSLTTR